MDKMRHERRREQGTTPRSGAPAYSFSCAGAVDGGVLGRWFNSCSPAVQVIRIPRLLLVCFALAGLSMAPSVRAGGPVPVATDLPQVLSLDDALKIFRARGLDLLIAEAAVKSAEGDVGAAGAVPNPVVSGGYGRVFNYAPENCPQCSSNYWAVGLSDSAALEDAISGKRGLRLKVARNALAAARLSRVDAQRTLEFQVKSTYLQVAQAVLAFRFAKEVAETDQKTLDIFQARYRSGAINEGDVARIETQKLESDQALDEADQGLRQARVALAFLVGVRGLVPDFEVDTKVLTFAQPPALADQTEERLMRTAFDRRPDLVAAGYQKASAEASIDLARRQRVPDITLSLNYSQVGTGGTSNLSSISPPMLVFGVSAPLPVFYQMQGELRRAEAAYDTNALGEAKATAQVVNDVATAYAAYVVANKLVQRMETGGLLKSAKTARDITRLQFEKGAAGLTDFLDAQRTYIATNVEYLQDETNYWTAVFQLEQAVGMELH
jgi:cobalt-zinc-cadmium efflux system outer membrane protein